MGNVENKQVYKDIICITAMEALEMIGVVDKLNTNGYTISIDAVQDQKGAKKDDDVYLNHLISIIKYKYIGTVVDKQYKKASLSDDEKKSIFKEMSGQDLDISHENSQVIHDVSLDKNGYCWYKHSILFYIPRLEAEETKDYAKRCFENIADTIINALEKKSEG